MLILQCLSSSSSLLLPPTLHTDSPCSTWHSPCHRVTSPFNVATCASYSARKAATPVFACPIAIDACRSSSAFASDMDVDPAPYCSRKNATSRSNNSFGRRCDSIVAFRIASFVCHPRLLLVPYGPHLRHLPLRPL